ncbi:CHRD domain-containing protein [Allosphingosinicella sp.]|uniref:CHRD domain-containing protein n=1 Tax=Allosphingosinicella sp. TaxID=2823234 RepID=UPI002F095D60
MKRQNVVVLMLACASALGLAACETIEEEVAQVAGARFHANLSGANEVPAGDPDGMGGAHLVINDTLNRICTDLEVRNIGPVTAAHIHRGAAGVNGPPVVTLDAPDDDDSDDCDTVEDALVDEIVRNPSGFYVNVHTADYPAGAIRGQLMRMP